MYSVSLVGFGSDSLESADMDPFGAGHVARSIDVGGERLCDGELLDLAAVLDEVDASQQQPTTGL
jgi:hypothetical protein